MNRFFFLLFLVASVAPAQIYDLLLKNGHVIDPANQRNGRMDVAIIRNQIAKVAPNLPASHARHVIDVS